MDHSTSTPAELALSDLSPAELAETVVTEVTVTYLRPGQTVIHGSQRYTVDHVESEGDDAAIFTTAGAGATITAKTYESIRVVTVYGIPAQPTMGEGRTAGTVAHFWGHIRLDGPARLVRRDEVEVGDTVHSSHYGKRIVTSVDHGTSGRTTELRFFSNDTDHPNNERYDSDSVIPRYESVKPVAEQPEETLEDALWEAIDSARRANPDVSSAFIVSVVLDTLRKRGIDVEG